MSKRTQILPVTLILYVDSEKMVSWCSVDPPDSKMGGAYRKRLLKEKFLFISYCIGFA